MNSSLRLLALAPLAAAGLFLTGCETYHLPRATSGMPTAAAPVRAPLQAVPAVALDASYLQASSAPFKFGPGDKLEIEVMGDPSTRSTVTVGPDGKIYYYMLPGMDIWGLTVPEVRDKLSDGLQKYMREKPVVSLTLRGVASQRVWVLGRINTPGVYTLNGPTTLLDAISQAGGMASASPFASLAASLGVTTPMANTAESADLSHAFIIRQGKMLPVDFQKLLREGDLTQNIYLQPDDFVFLPSLKSPQVHILGAVVLPHTEKMNGSLTVVQAIALAGGTTRDACLTNVAVLRGSLAHPEIAVVSVEDVIRGRTPDILLEPSDIVYVPYAPQRIVTKYVNLILDTFARTVGVNAGAHAVSNDASNVGVNVSIH